MADQNTFNFENYTQGQPIDFGNEQVLQGDDQIFNQNEAQIDPSTYFQEGNNVLKETAGIEGVTVNDDLFNQNNTFQDNTMDTNAIFGDTLKTGTEVPEYFGQGTTTTTNTNVVEGNNFFGDTTNQIQVNETNFDTNAFLTNTNVDTNTIFDQAQPIQTTTTTTKTTTQTNTNTYFTQAQEIQPQFGETQILPTTESPQFFDTNIQDFGQIQTESQNQFDQNSYEPYKATGAVDINALGYGTTETQTGFNATPANITPPPQPFFPPAVPITQTQTTTKKTVIKQNPIPEPVFPNTTQTYEKLDYEPYPTTTAPTINQFQQTIDATPLTTSTTITQTEPQYINNNINTNIIPQANIQATYTAIPPPQPKITYVQTNNVITQPTTNYAPVEYNQNYTTTEIPVQTTQYTTQTGRIPGYQYINKLVDEDFKRGRPVYNENVVKPVRPVLQTNGQANQIVAPTYQIREVNPNIKNNIGLSRLGYSNSYNLGMTNVPTINQVTPTINTPNLTVPTINTPNINVPTINTPNLNVPTINTPNLTVPTINTPNLNVPTINTPNINVPTINTPNLNVPTINTPNINVPSINTPNLNVPTINTPNINVPTINTQNLNVPSINTPNINTNLGNVGNTLNNNINTLNNNLTNNVNNVVGNINSGLDKIGKASSYNVGANTITPLLNNAGLQTANIASDNTRLPQLKDFL